MTNRIKWPDAEIALVFVRPVFGLSEEVQLRMIDKAVKQLGIRHEIYRSPIKGDKEDERGSLLRDCRGTEVVVLARLNVLGRPRAEIGGKSVSREFLKFVGSLRHKCKYILVLDDNLQGTPPNSPITSDDKDWEDVLDRATDVVTNGRSMASEKAKELIRKRWAGTFRGVRDEWTNNPERAEEREAMTHIWCSHEYKTAKEAFAAMPEHVRKQIKNTQMAGKIFGPRKPGSGLGRPKQSTED